MASVPFHYLDLRAFAHATERAEAVERALRTFLPAEATIDVDRSEGHFGQPIHVLSTRIETAEGMRAVLERLAELPAADRERLLGELEERVDDDCSFYVSFDKQAAASGEARLGEGITLRGKVEAYPARQPAAVDNAREALESL